MATVLNAAAPLLPLSAAFVALWIGARVGVRVGEHGGRRWFVLAAGWVLLAAALAILVQDIIRAPAPTNEAGAVGVFTDVLLMAILAGLGAGLLVGARRRRKALRTRRGA